MNLSNKPSPDTRRKAGGNGLPEQFKRILETIADFPARHCAGRIDTRGNIVGDAFANNARNALRRLIGGAMIVTWLGVVASASAHAAAVVREGLTIDDHAIVGGKSLALNGSAVRTRFVFKTHVGALYLAEPTTTVDAVLAQTGPKRMQMNMLVEVSSRELGKRFVDDYRAVTTAEESPKLINELFQVGGLFAGIPRVAKGDRLSMDWLPGKGYQILFNEKPLMSPVNNELFYKVLLRLFLGKAVPSDYRDGLLGLETSATQFSQREH